MNEELRAELLGRADRDQAARNSLPPGGSGEEWYKILSPVDEPNTAWMREVVAARGDASPRDLAYLQDRVLMFRGEPQIHGTQYMICDGVPELWAVRDLDGLDERRAALGLPPEHENRARLLADDAG
jgi:hypothetical protein